MPSPSNNFLGKTITHLRDIWRDATDFRARREQLELSAELSEKDEATLREWIDHCLEERGGEVAARARRDIGP